MNFIFFLIFNSIRPYILYIHKPVFLKSFLYPFLCASKEKGEKKRRPVKSLFPRSLRVFSGSAELTCHRHAHTRCTSFPKNLCSHGTFQGDNRHLQKKKSRICQRSEGRHAGLPLRFSLAIPDTKTIYNFDKYRILAILSSFFCVHLSPVVEGNL